MAFRRRRLVRRRAPFTRRRRMLKPVWRGWRRRHRRRTPVLYCKLTRTVQLNAVPNAENNFALHVTLNDFAEHINLAANFERVKVLRQVVRVYPQQNVSNNSTSRTGSYCLLPYHKPAPTTPVNFPTALSIDKAKIFRNTQKGRMSFVPAARLVVDASPANQAIRTDWKPEFEISTGATLPNLYTGMLVVENLGALVLTGTFYTVVQDLYVRYRNQRSFV